ncbi:MAG: nucleotidyltransferase domain-containing protein [Candidatus Woesearchaeota archaeon]
MTLFNFIEKEPLATKVFGRAEIEIIKKQLIGIKLSQSEKNRLSRSIRPKFEFIKKCSAYREEFEIKKGGEAQKQLNLFKEKALLDPIGRDIIKIYLFGSFVENKMSHESDVDVAVEFKKISLKEASLFKKRMMMQKPNLIDLSIYNNLPKNIQKQIKNNGKILFEDTRQNT